jgi:hypothetical protein
MDTGNIPSLEITMTAINDTNIISVFATGGKYLRMSKTPPCWRRAILIPCLNKLYLRDSANLFAPCKETATRSHIMHVHTALRARLIMGCICRPSEPTETETVQSIETLVSHINNDAGEDIYYQLVWTLAAAKEDLPVQFAVLAVYWQGLSSQQQASYTTIFERSFKRSFAAAPLRDFFVAMHAELSGHRFIRDMDHAWLVDPELLETL